MCSAAGGEATIGVDRYAGLEAHRLPYLVHGGDVLFDIPSAYLDLKPFVSGLDLVRGNTRRLVGRTDDSRVVGRHTIGERAAQEC